MDIIKNQIKSINLYDVQKYSLTNFKNYKTNGNGAVGWVDGIVFSLYQGDSEFIQKELIQNKTLHFTACDFAEMPKYEQIVQNEHGAKTLCVDQSTNPILKELANYLKKYQS